MIEGIPKISVLVITYNQEDVIGRAIDSLLSQKDYIYEICVSDDCSKDKTWAILQDYSIKYPGLFVLNRNEPNIGIFENIEKTWTMPTGDIVYQLSGDDECGEGWFKNVIEYLYKQNVDIRNELFCVYGDYMEKYPNGATITHSQKIVSRNEKTLKLGLRGLINNRSACFNIHVLKKFIKVSKGRSYVVENAQDRQLQLFSEKNYYIPYVGNIYYASIGVSGHLSPHILEEQRKEWLYLETFINKNNVYFDKRDNFFIRYRTSLQSGKILLAFVYWIRCLEIYNLKSELKLYWMKLIKKTPLFAGRHFYI